jgi:hypothetical protein
MGLLARINAWKMWVLCDREPVKTWSAGRVTAEVRNALFSKRSPQQALEGMAWLYDGK